jgi:hypothetical protein
MKHCFDVRTLLPLVLCFSGCAASPAYDHAVDNMDAIMRRYDASAAAVGSTTKVPWMAAKFCLERAKHNAGNAKLSTGFDAFFLISAGVTAGVGTGSLAASSGSPARLVGVRRSRRGTKADVSGAGHGSATSRLSAHGTKGNLTVTTPARRSFASPEPLRTARPPSSVFWRGFREDRSGAYVGT